jgi:cholesterol oxidase
MTTNRRIFGARLLEAAAALGLESIGPQLLRYFSSASAIGAAACASRANDELEALSAPLVHLHSDVVIVGSGYGGAVTAKRLTEKGASVLMLEMGRLWNTAGSDGKAFCSILNPDGRALWFRDNLSTILDLVSPVDLDVPIESQAGAIDLVESPAMKVYCGRGVGGGSLFNMAMLVTPPRDVLVRVLPALDPDEMLATYYPRASAMLDANLVRPSFFRSTPWYQYSRVGFSAAQSAGFQPEFLSSGYDYAYMEKEAAGLVPASACNYEAAFGNNYGKASLDKNYLADAIATGRLTLESLHIVQSIRREAGGMYVLQVNAIDARGALVARKEVTCKRLFLCGGSMGTSELLVRARESGTLPDLNDKVGTGWGPNSDIFVMRGNHLLYPTGDKVSTVPCTGFRTVDQDGKPVFSMDIPFPVGLETFISFNIVMTENPESGTFRYNAVSDKVELQWAAEQNAPAVKSARHVFDKLNRAAGSAYNTLMFRGKEFQDQMTYHPVGGCPLGEATDSYGRVIGYDGLYIADGSLIPRGLLANPALTIAALAERNIERTIAEDFRL